MYEGCGGQRSQQLEKSLHVQCIVQGRRTRGEKTVLASSTCIVEDFRHVLVESRSGSRVQCLGPTVDVGVDVSGLGSQDT